MRTFIALALPTDFVSQTARLAHQLERFAEGRFMDASTYHLTLAFLGEVYEADMPAILGALDAAALRLQAPELICNGLGKFGRPADATLWLGLAPTGALMACAQVVREELELREVPFDPKPFKPHITLARRARIPKDALFHLAFPHNDVARDLTLFKSELSQSGAAYKPLYTRELPRG